MHEKPLTTGPAAIVMLVATCATYTVACAQMANASPARAAHAGPSMHRPLVHLDIERLEYRWQNGADVYVWDVQGSIGGENNKLWLKSEGEKEARGHTEAAHIEALYARRVIQSLFLQAGLRHEARPRPSRTSLAFGVQSEADPFALEATAYLNEKGRLWARLELDYDVELGKRLTLQPRFEAEAAASSEPERDRGSGFRTVEIGLRLHYEATRKLAPYVGVSWSRKLGRTADFARQADEPVTEKGVVAGIKISL